MTTATKAPSNIVGNIQNTVTPTNETKEERVKRLETEMNDAANAGDFEKAIKLREEIKGIE